MRKDDALKFFPKINPVFPFAKKTDCVAARDNGGAERCMADAEKVLEHRVLEVMEIVAHGGVGGGSLSINHGGDKALQ